MATAEGPQPKRRRTEEVHTSETSIPQANMESIAQANSTVNIFMGQNSRQHRWMSGFVSEPRNEQAPGQTQPPVSQNGSRNRPVSLEQPQILQPPPTRPLSRNSTATAHVGRSNLVNYESPVTSAPLPSNAPVAVTSTSRKSMDRVTSGGSVGLPSPVSSDGAMNSPATMLEAASRRGRPPNDTRNSVPAPPVLPSNSSPMPRTHAQMQPPLPPTSRPQQYSRTEHPTYVMPRGYHVPSNAAPTQPTQTAHSHPYTPAQPVQATSGSAGILSWQQMLQRLESFEKSVLSKLTTLNHVDAGRITLLREAIEKQDWFYVCLSQIHCLTLTPQSLPKPAREKISMQAVTYLDMLLCPNSKLNFPVLKWLSDFPASVQNIYSSSAREMYDQSVEGVAGFLQQLPTGWDSLVDECKKRAAPPLMDDLLEKFALRSPVLQTTIFRAISRMVKEGSDPLEQLHRLDQEAFARGQGMRSPYERIEAYQAFRETINELQLHEQIPMGRRKRFTIPPKAIAVFQIRIPAPTPVQVQSAQMNHSNPNHRQQSVHLNNRQVSHNRQVSINAASQPQAQPSTSTVPMVMLYGNILMPKQLHQANRRLIFPHETEQPRAQPTHPDTLRSALHQAYLRSPTLTPTEMAAPRLYRHVTGFAMPPRLINKALAVEMIDFNISQELYDVLPLTVPAEQTGAPPSRSLNEKTYTIRLRCASGTAKALATESSWMEADNAWPDNLFLSCNSHMLEPRRKLHHNRYLPIDITTLVKPGRNQLTVIVNRMTTDTRPYEYALAVEIVGIMAHDSIGKRMKQISAAESLAAIKKALAPSDSDEDEITVTSSNMTIQLFDPHTLTKIFDIPVRGAACLHKDCFDLEIFLSQRDPKNRPGTPSSVDCWRCPICRGDVRPQTLIRDGFMDQVREELARKSMLDTRQIVVEPDGSWKPKEEETGGVRSPSLEREERGASAKAAATGSSATKPSAAKVIEIIEID